MKEAVGKLRGTAVTSESVSATEGSSATAGDGSAGTLAIVGRLAYLADAQPEEAPAHNHHRAMTDIVDPDKRSEIMSRIRGRDTEPEMIVRRIAHGLGFRFRLHRRDLPGSPDLVLPRYRAVIMVHGCFWHRHPGCKYASSPKTRVRFWEGKFEGNVVRDRRNETALLELGWRVMVVWECETKDRDAVAERIIAYLGEDGGHPDGGSGA